MCVWVYVSLFDTEILMCLHLLAGCGGTGNIMCLDCGGRGHVGVA